MYLLDLKTNLLVEAEIIVASIEEMPLKKDGWNFNWKVIFKKKNNETFIIRLKSNPKSIQGVLQLRKQGGMLIMELVEIAPHNIGRKHKRYAYVAGCLIAFACKKSFLLENNYKGFLTFESKTKLIDWYMEKYRAKIVIGQKMYIEPDDGRHLINEYLQREKQN